MRPRPVLLAALALAACGDNADVPVLVASPAHGSMFGNYDVTLTGDIAALGDITSVTADGIAAYDVRAGSGSSGSDSIVVTLQGSGAAGDVDIAITGAHGAARADFTYDAQVAKVPLTWVAFGASLTMGSESLGVNTHSQLHAVSALVATQAGVYLGMPLYADGILPGLQLSDFTPDCVTTKSLTDFFSGLIKAVTDPTTGLVDLRLGRVDPTLVPRDYAVAESHMDDIVNGGDETVGLLERIVEEPDAPPSTILDRLDISQIDRIVAADPDVGFSTDFLANDIDNTVLGADDLHLDAATPLATLTPLVMQATAKLGALHGQYFIANLPYLTFLPNVAVLRAQRIAAGSDTEASFDAKVQQIDDLTDQFNAMLVQAMAPYPNLHVVDFHSAVQAIRMTGITAGGELLTVAHFGGLLSLDDLHFTDTGYAYYANVFIDAINAQLGSQITHVDLDAVHATDALTPTKLRAAGFTCVGSGSAM
jgi:hypothetical protein